METFLSAYASLVTIVCYSLPIFIAYWVIESWWENLPRRKQRETLRKMGVKSCARWK